MRRTIYRCYPPSGAVLYQVATNPREIPTAPEWRRVRIIEINHDEYTRLQEIPAGVPHSLNLITGNLSPAEEARS